MILTGSSKDGRDARPFEGMYMHPNGKTWSSQPITKEQKEHSKGYRGVVKEIDGKRSFKDEYNRVLEKRSKLSKWLRDWLVIQVDL